MATKFNLLLKHLKAFRSFRAYDAFSKCYLVSFPLNDFVHANVHFYIVAILNFEGSRDLGNG